MKMHEYNRALDLRQLHQMIQEYRSNDTLNTAILTDIGQQQRHHTDQAAYYLSEAGYFDAKAGRLQSLSDSRLRELRGMRTALFDRDGAEVGVFRAGVVAEANADRARKQLETRQLADFDRLLETGLAVTREQVDQIRAERAVQTAERRALVGRENVYRAQDRTSNLMARAIGYRGRTLDAQAATEEEKLSLVRAQRQSTIRQQEQVKPLYRAQAARLGAEARLTATGHAQRLQGRAMELEQETGAIAASGAARGHTGSFQRVRTAMAEQAAARDVERFELENDVAELQLAQDAVQIRKDYEAEWGRLDVQRKQINVAERQAIAGAAKVREGHAELSVEGGRLAERRAGTELARGETAVDRARINAALAQLDTRSAEVADVQARLRSRTEQGKLAVGVQTAERTGRGRVRTRQLDLAGRREALITAQDRARGEEIAREGIQTTEAKAQATLSEARARRSRAGELRSKAGLEVDKTRTQERVRLENLAEAVVRWQITNLPAASEYKSGGGPSKLGILMQGLATVFG